MINLFWSIPQRFFHNAIAWPLLVFTFKGNLATINIVVVMILLLRLTKAFEVIKLSAHRINLVHIYSRQKYAINTILVFLSLLLYSHLSLSLPFSLLCYLRLCDYDCHSSYTHTHMHPHTCSHSSLRPPPPILYKALSIVVWSISLHFYISYLSLS